MESVLKVQVIETHFQAVHRKEVIVLDLNFRLTPENWKLGFVKLGEHMS